MNKQSIAMIKEQYKNNTLLDSHIEELRLDKRKGVQKIVADYDKNQEKKAQQIKIYNQKRLYEQQFCMKKDAHIAGVDEAGRGPLAGPVVAAAVILPDSSQLIGLTDSKQLSETKRTMYYEEIIKTALSYHISIIDNKTIDNMNILEATKLAMYEALRGLDIQPHIGLIDAVTLTDLPFPTQEIIKGDDKSISIAAASVLAKVTRDRIMEDADLNYPEYGFSKNKGYGTKDHLAALRQLGPCPIHRLSFTPVEQSTTE